MRIRSLEITGFKSFGERAVLAFDRGISAIVGPNGCGKSNVVDAIRWVMGEQNPRHLRGRAMEDMIFAGTESKPAVGMSEVVITLDNSDGSAPGAYAGFGEIQIARRLYRSGESEYAINKTPCRLRDVLDFFLDTGVGTRGYTIVEQGRVAEIVSTKPEERRFIFEEAAGIGKYRVRRREAERKLKATEDNLLRVSDILGELKRQIGSLDRQAAKANRYKKLSARLRDLELGVSRQEFLYCRAKLDEADEEIERLRTESVALDARVARADADLEAERRTHVEQERALQDVSERLFRVRSEIQSLEGRVEYERRERDGLARMADEREQEVVQLEAQLEAHLESERALEGERASIDERIDSEQRELGGRESELREHVDRLAAVQSRREVHQNRVVQLSAEEGTLRSRAQSLDERRTELEARLVRNEQALVESEERAEGLRRDETSLAEQVGETVRQRDELAARLEDQQRSHREILAALEAKRFELAEVRTRVEQVSARLDSLRDIEHRESQRVSSTIERLPEAERASVVDLLSRVLRVEDGLEAALEAVLAGKLEAVLVDGPEGGFKLLSWMRREAAGRATVLPLAAGDDVPLSGFVPLGRPLVDFVTVEPAYRGVVQRLLADVYLVDDLAQAVARFGIARPPAVFVTREGELLDRSGAVTGGQGVPPGAISRAGEIRRLSAALESYEARREDLRALVAGADAHAAELGREIDGTRVRLHEAELAVAGLGKDLDRTREREREARQSVAGHRESHAQLRADIERALASGQEIAARRAQIEREHATVQQESEALRVQIAELTAERDRLEQRLVQVRVALAELGARRDQIRLALDRLQSSIADGRSWIERRRGEIREARERAQALAASSAQAEQELSSKIRSEEAVRAEQDALREAYEASSQRLETCEAEARTAVREREALREKIGMSELSAQEVRLQCDQLRSRIRERYDVDLDVYEPPAEHLEGSVEEREQEVSRLREQLRALGDVHLGAIEEYEEVSERHRYLSEQKADLEVSIERLRSAIARINRTSRARFRETFEAVDAEFRKIFPRMFNGGRAELRLTESEDVLEAGIEIVAQPPGKKLQSVNLLSGGEKSLTAISLLMAVFTVKPSPFFLLDEVDAALDDANAGKFNELLRERGEQSQFLMITHNKGSIEMADTLYGVTMQEPGLSKLVTVDLVS